MPVRALFTRLSRTGRHAFIPALLLVGAAHAPLATTFPDALPSPAVRRGWDRIDGILETPTSSTRYDFYVNPDRPGFYAVTHYRVTQTAPGLPDQVSTEKLLWNSRPPAPILLYQLVDGRWQPLAHGTAAYRAEMFTAIKLYVEHNRRDQERARLSLEEPER